MISLTHLNLLGAQRQENLVKVGVIVPARNEEGYLGKTLEHLLNQTLKPEKIVVVDDGSLDKTAELAEKYGVSVIRLPTRPYDVVGMPQLAAVLNKGFEALTRIADIEYVIVVGADHILPEIYIENIILRMEEDKNLVMASGRLLGERSYSDMPTGSGRVYRLEFMQRIGFFPLNYGWEDYPLFKAMAIGYTIRCFEGIVTWEQRPIKLSAKKLYYLGKGMRALGYDPFYFVGKCALMLLKTPKGALSMLRGYISSNVQKYSDLGDFARKWQARTLWKRLAGSIKG